MQIVLKKFAYICVSFFIKIKNMRTIKLLKELSIFVLLVMLIYSCEPKYKYSMGKFPNTPTNLTDFNTQYDDYNATAPSLGETFPFCFSSNRNNGGNNFDIIYKLMSIDFSKTSGILKVYNNTSGNSDVVIENSNINNALSKINTTSDEFGPYLIPNGRVIGGTNINNRYETYILLYSSGIDGNQDIMFTHNLDSENYILPQKVDFINSDFDDQYPTFNNDYSKIYFSSNREGVYNIYSNATDNTKNIIEILNSTSSVSEKDTVLSSDFDDRCPFINGNLLVFASNRDGGYGGYDLYYSILKNGKWTTPINFGNKINTQYDEFRPIVRKEGNFSNDFMIFSSNRPGGKGGFDLYYVGIEKFE